MRYLPFLPRLHFFAPYLPQANLCKSNFWSELQQKNTDPLRSKIGLENYHY